MYRQTKELGVAVFLPVYDRDDGDLTGKSGAKAPF